MWQLLNKCFLISAVSFCLISCKDEIAEIGHNAPELAAFDLQGQPVSLRASSQKTTLLSFWSETCGVCLAELKTLEKMAAQYPNKIKLLAINVDGEKYDTQKIVTHKQLTLPIAKDQLKITAERYQLVGTPTSFIIDNSGKIRQKYEGLIPQKDLKQLFSQGNL